jgi:hypothetical protein
MQAIVFMEAVQLLTMKLTSMPIPCCVNATVRFTQVLNSRLLFGCWLFGGFDWVLLCSRFAVSFGVGLLADSFGVSGLVP